MLMPALTKRNVQNRGAKETRARKEAKKARMMKKRKRKSSHKSRKKNNNLGVKVKGCVVEVEAVEERETARKEERQSPPRIRCGGLLTNTPEVSEC